MNQSLSGWSSTVLVAWVLMAVFGFGFLANSFREGSDQTAGAELAKNLNAYERERAKAQDGTAHGTLPGEPQALARVGNLETIAIGRDALLAIDRAETVVTRFRAEVAPLLTNEDGRVIATATDLVRSFRSALGDTPRAPPDLSVSRDQVQALLEPARSAADSEENTATISPATRERLDAAKNSADTVAARYAETIEAVALVVARAGGRGIKPGSLTLADAIEKQRLEERARDTIRKETDATIAGIKADSPEYQALYEAHRRPPNP